ncbi:hypothetical protein ABHZ00_21125, partial [Bacteroides uniformis]
MKNTYLIAALLISCTTSTFAQYKGLDVVKVANSQQPYINENIHIPDIEGYKTLKCDFHTQYLQPIITQYFIDNKSEIWLLFLIAH